MPLGIDLDHDVVDRFHRLELRIREHVVVEVARFDVTRRKNQVGGLHGLDHIEDGESARLQQRRVQVDVDLANFPALNRSGCDVSDLFNLRRDGVIGQIVEPSFVEVAARYRDHGDGNIGDVELDDERLQNTGRQAVEDLGDALHHFHLPHVDICAPVEPDLNRPNALFRERFDMLDVRGGTDGLFDGIDHALLDIERGRPFINDADKGDRHLNIGEQIDRKTFERRGSQNDHGQGQHQDADTVSKCEECQPHNDEG